MSSIKASCIILSHHIIESIKILLIFAGFRLSKTDWKEMVQLHTIQNGLKHGKGTHLAKLFRSILKRLEKMKIHN